MDHRLIIVTKNDEGIDGKDRSVENQLKLIEYTVKLVEERVAERQRDQPDTNPA